MINKINKLYCDIGDKIKKLAIWQFILESLGAIISGLFILIDGGFEDAWWAIFIILFGPVIAFVSSWILYAFGQIVEDIHDIRNKNVNSSVIEENENTVQSNPVTEKKIFKAKNNATETEEERMIPRNDIAEFR